MNIVHTLMEQRKLIIFDDKDGNQWKNCKKPKHIFNFISLSFYNLYEKNVNIQ